VNWRLIATIYFIGGVAWYLWSKNQGYATDFSGFAVWPYRLYQQKKDEGAAA
jgi:hypothetical protein